MNIVCYSSENDDMTFILILEGIRLILCAVSSNLTRNYVLFLIYIYIYMSICKYIRRWAQISYAVLSGLLCDVLWLSNGMESRNQAPAFFLFSLHAPLLPKFQDISPVFQSSVKLLKAFFQEMRMKLFTFCSGPSSIKFLQYVPPKGVLHQMLLGRPK